jgi:hypothetical protein
MATRYHQASIDGRDCSEAGRPCQHRLGDPCDRRRPRMSPRQARPALLSQPLYETTTAQPTPSVQPFAVPLVCRTNSSGSRLDRVGRFPPWDQGRVETADEVCDAQYPGARPVRRVTCLLGEGEVIVHRLFTHDPRVTESTTQPAPDSGPRADPRPLCPPGGR